MKYCKLKILAFYTSQQLLLSFGLKGSIKDQEGKEKDNQKSLLCCDCYGKREELDEKDIKIKDLETKIYILTTEIEKNIKFFKENFENLEKRLEKKKDKPIPQLLPAITTPPPSNINNLLSFIFKK